MGQSGKRAGQVSKMSKKETAFAAILSQYEEKGALGKREKARLKWMFEQGYTHASIDALQGQNVYLNAELSLRSDPRPAEFAF